MAGEAGVSDSEPPSPSAKVKFLCSYGGKILPRSNDGHLKYVGGETRVVSIPRVITFSQFQEKLSSMFDGDMVLKYQLMPEDLDALVSVKSDEDLKHMIDEHDRHESEGSPKLRAFLFPANPIVVENQLPVMEPLVVEQKYIDAINNIVRVPFVKTHTNRATLSVSSACSSPKSISPDSPAQENGFNRFHGNMLPIHKVHSSPSLSCLSNLSPNNSNHGNPLIHQYHQYNYPNNHQHPHHNHYFTSKPPVDPHRGLPTERPFTASLLGKLETGKSSFPYGLNRHHSLGTSRYYRGAGGCNRCCYYDEYGVYGCARPNGPDSLPASPRKPTWEG